MKRIVISKRLIFLLVALTFLISGIAIYNASQMQKDMARKTELYVKDVAFQVAKDIDFRLSKITSDLDMLGQSLKELDELGETEKLMDFLKRNAELLGFQCLIIAIRKENCFAQVNIRKGIRTSRGFRMRWTERIVWDFWMSRVFFILFQSAKTARW